MDTTTDRSTLMQSEDKMVRSALGAAAAGMRPGTDEKRAATVLKGDDNIGSRREALEATDEDTTNPYDESQEDKQSQFESSSSTAIVSANSSGSRSEAGPLADAPAATITGSKSALHGGAGSSSEGKKRPTHSYQDPQSSLKVTPPSRNAVAQPQGSPTSANTSAAFPEDVSKVVELSTPTPLRSSNFVGGPGGHHRSGPLSAAARTPASPPPSAPQTANTSAFYAFSDSYAIPQSTAANAPSFSIAYPPSIRTGAGISTVYTPQQAPYQTVPSGPSARTAGSDTALVAASIITSVGPSLQQNDDEEHAQRKHPWVAATNADGNQPRHTRRIRIQDEVVEENEERSEEGTEGTRETYTGSSYSDEESSYRYSYSEEDDYEYYEEFYEEEVEEDEEDEEEPHIDMIEGDTHGHTLHDILYGTPKAGGNPSRSYSREYRESMRSENPLLTAPKGKEEPRHRGHVHQRHSGEIYSRSASANSSEAADEAAAVHRRSTTPERVNQQPHRQKATKVHERTGSEDGSSGHRAAAAAGKKRKKRDYEHGEPYTEGTFKGASKKKSKKYKKVSAHYGATEDLDQMEMIRSDSDLVSSKASHEPITSAARAGQGSRAACYSSRSSDSTDIDDNDTARWGSRPNHRERRLTTREAKDHRGGVEGAEEAMSTRKLVGTPSRQRRAGASNKASENAVGATVHDGEGGSSKKDAKREDGKARKKSGIPPREDDCSSHKDDGDAKDKDKLLIKCACCSKEGVNNTDKDKKKKDKRKDEEEKGSLLRRCACCSTKKDDTKAKDKRKDEEGGPLRRCSCCSTKDDTKAKDKRKDEEEKGGLLIKCACCSKENDAKSKDKDKDKSGLQIKCTCCSKEGDNGKDKDKKKKDKGSICGRLRSLFCFCRGKKSTKAQVADKGKHDKRKESDTASTEKEDGANSDETSTSTSGTTSPQRSRSTSPVKAPGNHQLSIRQTNRKHRKMDEVFKASKSLQAKQQEEAKGHTADTPEPASPVSSASMRGEKEDRSEDEASVSVSKKAAHQRASRHTPRSTGQDRRMHSRAESTGAQKGASTRSADRSRVRGKPEVANVATPSGVSDVGENDEPGASKSAQARRQQRRRHRQRRVLEQPKRRSRTNRQHKEDESSHRRSEAK